MQNTDINVQTTYNLAFPNDNKIGVTEIIQCGEHMETACSGWLSFTYGIKGI